MKWRRMQPLMVWVEELNNTKELLAILVQNLSCGEVHTSAMKRQNRRFRNVKYDYKPTAEEPPMMSFSNRRVNPSTDL